MPTIHLVRHAQGFHNLSAANQQIPDPLLTDFGKQQCADLSRRFPYQAQLTHLVASPMRRTLYTALLSFEPAAQQQQEGGSATGKRVVIALPEIQELSVLPCDVGSDRAALAAEFGDSVDLSNVGSGWNHKGPWSPWAPEMARLTARAGAARRWLRDLATRAGEDAHIAVVTHGGFLHFLTEDWDGVNPDKGE